MTKLLYITNGINGSGGLERVLSVKTSYLAEHYGYDITILCLNGHHKNPFYDFSNKINTLSIDVWGNPLSYFSNYIKDIKRAVKNINPDIISVCDDGLKGFLIPLFLGKKIPIIYERHASVQLNFKNENPSSLNTVKNKTQLSIMRWAATKFDRFVVLTTGNLNEWKPGNLQVIPNPLSFYPEVLPHNNNKNIIVVGSHSYNKGYDLLLISWMKIQNYFPDWKLLIYGKKDSQQTYITLAKQMGLIDSVQFHDPVQDIEQAYYNASILALPSRSEGFGMVLIEAMACGLPCVSYNCPHGPGDIITEGKDGFLVENENSEDFAEKIMNLISDPELRRKMGKQARQDVLRYSPENIGKIWNDLFMELAR